MSDGEIFNTITNGKGQMMGYGYNIAIDDRWRIIMYIRALQHSAERQARGRLARGAAASSSDQGEDTDSYVDAEPCATITSSPHDHRT